VRVSFVDDQLLQPTTSGSGWDELSVDGMDTRPFLNADALILDLGLVLCSGRRWEEQMHRYSPV
jgi:hypothetical protein